MVTTELLRGVADLVTASGSTTITAVRIVKMLSPLKFCSLSTHLLHMYVLIAQHIISN